jgi:uracil-DNA glycosylase family 4
VGGDRSGGEVNDELLEVARDLRRYVAWLEPEGRVLLRDPTPQKVEPPPVHGERSRAAAESYQQKAANTSVTTVSQVPKGHSGTSATSTPVLRTSALAERGTTLEQIRAELGDCKRCKLCTTRTNIVFGTGNPKAELVFVGEGPGADEDAQGVPFVGKAGQLLTKMIEAMGYARDEVYICNVVKCRPPGNRNPEPDEIAACEPFLKAQLAAIRPKAIVALGKFAAQTLLRDETSISRLRGHWRDYEGVPLMPTFHPAYVLRNEEDKSVKRQVWDDLQQVMARLGKVKK